VIFLKKYRYLSYKDSIHYTKQHIKMRNIGIVLLLILLSVVSCKQAKTFDKQQCMKDADVQAIYKEQTQAYCNCVEQSITQLGDTIVVNDSVIEAHKQACANEFTTLDTNF
jgi:hypothetical protein